MGPGIQNPLDGPIRPGASPNLPTENRIPLVGVEFPNHQPLCQRCCLALASTSHSPTVASKETIRPVRLNEVFRLLRTIREALLRIFAPRAENLVGSPRKRRRREGALLSGKENQKT